MMSNGDVTRAFRPKPVWIWKTPNYQEIVFGRARAHHLRGVIKFILEGKRGKGLGSEGPAVTRSDTRRGRPA